MLVLAATYHSHLGKLVDNKQLEQLLDRTIDFLAKHQAISPTLRKDAEILKDVKTRIFGIGSRRWKWRWKYKQKIRIRANTNYHLTEFHFFDKQEDEIKL